MYCTAVSHPAAATGVRSLQAGVQPTLDPSVETFISVPCASAGRGGELENVCGVCAHCIGWRNSRREQLVSYLTPHRWLFPECELNSLDEHSRSRHHKHGTLSLLTSDPATPYRHLNAISKPTFSLTLNWRHKRLCIPHRTLWRYTNVVLLLFIIISKRTTSRRGLLSV